MRAKVWASVFFALVAAAALAQSCTSVQARPKNHSLKSPVASCSMVPQGFEENHDQDWEVKENAVLPAASTAFLGGEFFRATRIWQEGLPSAAPSVNVLFRGYDTMHTGMNINETILTPANVTETSFGKRFSYAVDGQIFAQPLYVSQLMLNGALHNVAYVATENNSVYAFDADSALANPAPLWKNSYTTATSGPIPCGEVNYNCTVYPSVGTTATPAISLENNTIYVNMRSKDLQNDGTYKYTHTLHALNLTTGAEQPGSPVTICSAAAGGGCSYPRQGRLSPQRFYSRSGLIIAYPASNPNGVLFAAIGTFVLAYDAVSLQLLAEWNSNSHNGIWGAGAGLAADAQGNLYAVTADGTYTANLGGNQYGDAVIKLAFGPNSTNTGYQLTVLDSFAPENAACRYTYDQDLSAGGLMLLPPQPGAAPNLLVVGGKGFDNFVQCDSAGGPFYVVNRDHLGQLGGEIQTVEGPPFGYVGTAAFWQSATSSYVYMSGFVAQWSQGPGPATYIGDSMRAYSIGGDGSFSTTSSSATPTIFLVGSSPAVSSNGTDNGIVWTIERKDHLWTKPGTKPAVLHAYDANNLATEFYNSAQNPARDQTGPSVKFQVPVVANGNVYVGTQTQLSVYGLCPCPENGNTTSKN